MSNVMSSTWFLLGAAVVGIVSAASVMIAEQMRKSDRKHRLSNDLVRMNEQILRMKLQLDELQKERLAEKDDIKKKRRRQRSMSSARSSGDGFSSTNEIESSDLEFYDIDDETGSQPDYSVRLIDEKLESNVSNVRIALEELEEMLERTPDNVEVLWRIGKAHYKISMAIRENVPLQLEHIAVGLTVCQKALEIDEENGNTHKWYAILTGTKSDHQNLRDRVKGSLIFKKHLDKALILKPEDPTLYHLLGRYSFEIATLKWIERKAAAAIAAELPVCTLEEALCQLEMAERLGPVDWKENKLALAKCHLALGNHDDAIVALECAERIVVKSVGEDIDGEIKTMLEKYRKSYVNKSSKDSSGSRTSKHRRSTRSSSSHVRKKRSLSQEVP